jgi:hypothetical protein
MGGANGGVVGTCVDVGWAKAIIAGDATAIQAAVKRAKRVIKISSS